MHGTSNVSPDDFVLSFLNMVVDDRECLSHNARIALPTLTKLACSGPNRWLLPIPGDINATLGLGHSLTLEQKREFDNITPDVIAEYVEAGYAIPCEVNGKPRYEWHLTQIFRELMIVANFSAIRKDEAAVVRSYGCVPGL